MKIDIKRGRTQMRAISSHPAIKMRVLILSAALFACAAGAPSGAYVAPLAVVGPAIPLAPVNPGDLQGALIDAKVQAEDYIRAAADKTREVTEQAIEENKEKVVEIDDQAKERSLEAFWAAEEKKWQALDAVKTAEAQIDGQIASTSDITAKSLVTPAIVAPVAPVFAPISPYYLPGVIAPGIKTVSTSFYQFQTEAGKTEEKKEEAKTEKAEEVKTDSVQVESADLKAAEAMPEAKPEAQAEAKPEGAKEENKYVIGQAPILTPFAYSPLKFASTHWVSAPGLVQHELKPITYTYPGQLYAAPTVLKTVW